VIAIPFLFPVFPLFAGSLTKEAVYKNITRVSATPTFAFSAAISSRISMANRTVTDSGTIIFSPPDCYKVTMFKSKTQVAVLSDTSFITMPDGSCTRRIGQSAVSGMGAGSAQSFGPPSAKQLLGKSDFTIVEEKPGVYVVIEFESETPMGKSKTRATFDTKEWLLRNIKMTGMTPTGEIETGFSYTTFNGHTMVKEMNTVMGSAGFMKISYGEYKAINKISRKKFKVY
jgi:outer membrane lipoprotein-sorting protein